jgi:hypothetical protein
MKAIVAVLLFAAGSLAHAQDASQCRDIKPVGPGLPVEYIVSAEQKGLYCVGWVGVEPQEVTCTVQAPDQPPLQNSAARADTGVSALHAGGGIAAMCQFDPRPGASLTISGKYVVTNASGEKEARKFAVRFLGPEPRRWLPTFGLLMVENRDDEFFVADGTLTRERDKGGLELAPALLWAYPLSRSCDIDDTCWRLVAGIGANAERVLPFAGVDFSVGQNVGFSAGVTVTERTRLRGEYSVGQSFAEPPEGDALVEEKLDAALYLGITLRFDKSPFGD